MTATSGLSFPAYQALPGVNWSTLKHMADSPLHYRHHLTTPRSDTPAMRFGRAVHTAVLEPDRFPLEHIIWDGGDRRGNAWKEFAAANADRTILKTDEYAACLAVRDAVRAYAPAANLLRGESEVSIEWTDAETGIACKARLDHIHAGAIVDLKSTSSVDAHDFERTAADLLYHGQLSMYRRGLAACGADFCDDAPVIIAVESSAPYDVAVFEPTDDALRIGDGLVSDLLFRLAECRARDSWPGRFDGPQPLTLPPWLMGDDDTGLGIQVGGASA